MFLHFRNANTIQYKKSLHSKVVKKMYTKMSSVHGSNVLTVKITLEFTFAELEIEELWEAMEQLTFLDIGFLQKCKLSISSQSSSLSSAADVKITFPSEV